MSMFVGYHRSDINSAFKLTNCSVNLDMIFQAKGRTRVEIYLASSGL